MRKKESKKKNILAYAANKTYFSRYFGICAEPYWEMYRRVYQEGSPLELLERDFNYTGTVIRYIFKRIETFLEAPEQYCTAMKITCDELPRNVIICDELHRDNLTDIEAFRVCRICYSLVQHDMANFIPYDVIDEICSDLPGEKNHVKLVEELSKGKIKLSDGRRINIFRRLATENEGIYFEFTDEVLKMLIPINILSFVEA